MNADSLGATRIPPSTGELEAIPGCNLCGSVRLEDVYPSVWVRRCRDCGYTFRSPRPTSDSIAAFYSREGKYQHWLEQSTARQRCWHRRLSLLRRFIPSGRLLDVGAGIGEFVGKASPYFDATGTEVSQEAIRLARERLGLRLLHGAIEGASELKEGASELKAGSFDVISLIHVLEHVPDPAHTIRRCRELLRPGGWLFVAVPNDSPAAWYKCYWGTGRALWRHIRRSGTPISYEETPALGSVDLHLADASAEIHLSHFSPECLRRFLSREGFDAVFMGPDPCHTTTGLQRLKDDMDFHIWRMLALFGWHGYQTISVIARRAELR